jgi:TonB family protein
MKNSIVSLLLFLLLIPGFSQNSMYDYPGRFSHSIKKEKLSEASFIADIMPEFSPYFVLPFKESALQDFQRILAYPRQYFYPQEAYNAVIDIVSTEISVLSEDRTLNSLSKSDTLSAEQKDILNTAGLGTEIFISIRFRDKNESKTQPENTGNIKSGTYIFTIVPETEAEYPGGLKQITEYLSDYVINKNPGATTSQKIQQAIVNFTVDENGQTIEARISRSSTDPIIDQLLLDATRKMSNWSPAVDSYGNKVKQVFSIPFGGGC